MPDGPPTFDPPTPEQFAAHLEQHPPHPPSPLEAWGPLVAVAVVAVVGLVVGGPAGMILPWLALGGLFVFLTLRVRAGRSLQSRANRIQELAMLRHYPQVLRRAWRLLPAVVRQPPLHLRTVSLMAQCLDRVKCYDAAIVGYDYLLTHLPSEHPGSVLLRIQRAIAALSANRLADADDTLRRLRGVVEPTSRTPTAAAYRLAQLIQQVRTNHFADAIDASEGLLEDLRPLNIEAGYGHALMALCHHHGRGADADAARREANKWWSRATLLLPEAALVDRFPELTPLAASSTN